MTLTKKNSKRKIYLARVLLPLLSLAMMLALVVSFINSIKNLFNCFEFGCLPYLGLSFIGGYLLTPIIVLLSFWLGYYIDTSILRKNVISSTRKGNHLLTLLTGSVGYIVGVILFLLTNGLILRISQPQMQALQIFAIDHRHIFAISLLGLVPLFLPIVYATCLCVFFSFLGYMLVKNK